MGIDLMTRQELIIPNPSGVFLWQVDLVRMDYIRIDLWELI